MDIYLEFLQQHLLLTITFGLVFLALIANEIRGMNSGVNSVDCEQAVQLMNHQNALVIDYRKPEIFATGYIVNAIPNTDIAKLSKKTAKFKTKPMILVNENGRNLTTEITKLKNLEFTNILYLAGGMKAWQQAGLPICSK